MIDTRTYLDSATMQRCVPQRYPVHSLARYRSKLAVLRGILGRERRRQRRETHAVKGHARRPRPRQRASSQDVTDEVAITPCTNIRYYELISRIINTNY